MSTGQPPTSKTHERHYALRVNAYDRASSILISLLVMFGALVVGLLIIYFARQLVTTQTSIPVLPFDPASRPADAAMGLKNDIEPPGIEDAPELTEPKLQDTLNALTSAIASKTALISDEVIDSETDVGRGKGLGDNRAAGDGGEGGREPQREIRFEPASLDEYAQWLDYLGGELAVLGRDNVVYYASNFSQAKPDTRTGEPSKEKRLHFISAGTPLAPLDRRLVTKAGIADRGSLILQYFPPEVEGNLLGLEQQKAGDRSPDQIKRTVYRVTREGADFRFSVEEQQYY